MATDAWSSDRQLIRDNQGIAHCKASKTVQKTDPDYEASSQAVARKHGTKDLGAQATFWKPRRPGAVLRSGVTNTEKLRSQMLSNSQNFSGAQRSWLLLGAGLERLTEINTIPSSVVGGDVHLEKFEI